MNTNTIQFIEESDKVIIKMDISNIMTTINISTIGNIIKITSNLLPSIKTVLFEVVNKIGQKELTFRIHRFKCIFDNKIIFYVYDLLLTNLEELSIDATVQVLL